MTFLTNLGVTEILCNFRLFLDATEVKRYLSHQDQSSKKSFQQTILLYAEGNKSGPLNRRTIADLSLLRKLLAIPKKS